MNMLGIIASELNDIDIPYEFMRWSTSVQYPYFIGEYSQVTTLNEDGYEEYSFMLTGTTTGSWLELEDCRNKIKNHFPSVYGLRKSIDDGVMVIFYENAFPVPTGDANLKRIQINLNVKIWKGMI